MIPLYNLKSENVNKCILHYHFFLVFYTDDLQDISVSIKRVKEWRGLKSFKKSSEFFSLTARFFFLLIRHL